MTNTTHDIDALVKKANAITRHPSMGGAMAHAQDVLRDMSAALTDLQAERDAALEEANRLRTNRDRFPELMARVMAEKNLPLPDRIDRLKIALADLPTDVAKYQWEADQKPLFGEKYVRCVSGNDGEGMGRQWFATTPSHIRGLANYIAAANPDTVTMLLVERDAAIDLAEAAEAEVASERRAKECFQRMTRAHWEALCAMRNSINEYIPMPSTDSGPLFSPENGPIYADIAERVVADVKDNRAYALALEQELKARAEAAEGVADD